MVKLGLSYESLEKIPKQLARKMVLLYQLEVEARRKR